MSRTSVAVVPLRDDTPEERRRLEALAKRIYSESPYALKFYKNSRGNVIVNVTDPRAGSPHRVPPFVVRDEADWEERKPAPVKRRDKKEKVAKDGSELPEAVAA